MVALAHSFSLTEALAKLAEANADKVEFLKGLEVDTSTAIDGSTIVETGKVTEGNVNAYFGNAAANLDASKGLGTTLVAADYADLKKQALQDADMATAKTSAQGAINVATAAAKNGMTALIEAANTAQAEYVDAIDAAVDANTGLTAELAAFNSANGSAVYTTVVLAADYKPSDDNGTTTVVISNGKAYIGQNGSSAPVPLADLVEITGAKRVAELASAKATANAAATTKESLLDALKEAVGAIYVLESGGHSLKSIGADAKAVTEATGAYDLSGTSTNDVVVYKTAADTAKGVGKAATSVTFAAITWSDSTTATIKFDGHTINLSAVEHDTDAKVAQAIIAASDNFGNYVASGDGTGDVVTFTHRDIGESSEFKPVTGDFTFTPGAGTTAATGGAATVGVSTQVEAGDIVTQTAAAKADDLKGAIESLADLEKAIADFQDARDVKLELESLKDAIDDANKAITDSVEDGGLGVTLREGDQNFTTSDDVYLFDANKTTATNLTNFGAKGEDKIFFGEGFTGGLVEITKTKDDNGDASALEIFWLQNGNNVELYVEQKAFAGNGSTNADLVTITLQGVDGNDLSFADGFLAIA